MKDNQKGLPEAARPVTRSLQVKVEPAKGIAVVKLQGSAGILEAEQIRAWLDDLVTRDLVRISVELHDVDDVAATAVAAVVRSCARDHQCEDRICLLLDRNTPLHVPARNHLMELLPAR